MSKLLKKTLVFIISIAMIFAFSGISFAATQDADEQNDTVQAMEDGVAFKFVSDEGEQKVTEEEMLAAGKVTKSITDETWWGYTKKNNQGVEMDNKYIGTFYSVKDILTQKGVTDFNDVHAFSFYSSDGFTNAYTMEELEKLYVFKQADVEVHSVPTAGGDATVNPAGTSGYGTALASNDGPGNKFARDVIEARISNGCIEFCKAVNKGEAAVPRHYCAACGASEPTTAVAAVAATCQKEGTEAYWTGNWCHAMFSEETPAFDVNEITEPVKIARVDHNWVAKTEAAGNLKNGKSYDQCSMCNAKQNEKIIPGTAPSYVKSLKVKKGKKAFTVKWKKQSKKNQKKFNNYQIRYSTKADMSGAKTITAKKSAKSKKVTKLAKKTKYYVQVRTVTKANGSTFYSKWSATKTVKTK